MGNKISKILKNKDVGAIGIGAMIVFIAMILVAGIAASVLVQTANKLEIQAMQTGDQTTAEVATGLKIVDVVGEKNTDIEDLAITVQPRAGSSDIDLSETFIEISDSSMKNVLTFAVAAFHDTDEINGNVFQTDFFDNLAGGQSFGVVVLEDADSSCSSTSPVINRGDKVMLTIQCGSGDVFNQELGERTDVWGMVQPEDGAPGVFGFRTPASYAGDTVFDLY